MTARRRRALHAVATVLVVAAAAVIWHHLPAPSDVYRPFDVHGAPGEPVSGRLFDVTVTGVRTGQEVQAPRRPPAPAAGRWVLVDTDLVATDRYVLPRAELLVGPNTYAPSERFQFVQLGGELAPLITQRGSWAFDVAPDLLNRSTMLSLRVWSGDHRLDSRVVVEIPYADAVFDDAPLTLAATKESA